MEAFKLKNINITLFGFTSFFFLLLLLGLTPFIALAQASQDTNPSSETSNGAILSFHIGPAFPLNDFADDDPDDLDSGFAGTGITLGGKITYPINSKGLGVFAGLNIAYNGIQRNRKDDIEDIAVALDVDVNKLSRYLNIPVSAGLDYTYKPSPKAALYSHLGIIISFLKFTDYELEGNNLKYSETYNLTNSFGFNIGGGIILNSKTVLGISYLNLGQYDIDGEYDNSDSLFSEFDDRGRFDVDRQITMLTFTIGIQL